MKHRKHKNRITKFMASQNAILCGCSICGRRLVDVEESGRVVTVVASGAVLPTGDRICEFCAVERLRPVGEKP